jgi:hypothetical protein
MEDLEVVVELARPVDEPVRFRTGVAEITLTSGVMVPVFSGHYAGAWEHESARLLRLLRDGDPQATLPGPDDRGDRELVGFVWVKGEGQMAVRMPHEADAMEFANRQVLHMGADATQMRKVAFGLEPFRTVASEGLFLSADDALDSLFLDEVASDPMEIVVWDMPADLSRARRLFEERVAVWERLGLDVGERIASERVLLDQGGELDHLWVVDLHTADRYARVSAAPTPADRWLAWVDRGGLSSSWDSEVVTAGISPGGGVRVSHISGTPRPPSDPDDPRSPPAPMGDVDIVHVKARVLANHVRNGLTLPVETTNRVRLRARHDVLFTDLVVPRVEAVPDSLVWVRASLPDGTPLARPEQVARDSDAVAPVPRARGDRPAPKPRPAPRPGIDDDEEDEEEQKKTAHRVRLVFPEVVRAGEEVVVDLQWTDTWPLANLGEYSGVGIASNGVTAGMQRFVAHVPGRSGDAYAYDVSVGLPDDSPLTAIVSGPMSEPVERDGWRFVEATGVQQARYPNVVVGRYRVHMEKAKKGMPAVTVALLGGDPKQLKGLAAQARSVMSYYEGFLPPYGLPAYHIVEAPSSWEHATWVAPHGMQMARTMNVRTDRVGTGQTSESTGWRLFGHEIAHQWWGQQAQPASLDDRWMVETFAEVFGCMLLAKATDDTENCTDRLDEVRRDVEGDALGLDDPRRSLSLTEAYREGMGGVAYYRYGPYVMQQMLRPRIGNAAFFGALDRLLRDADRSGVTNERLQAAFEAESAEDLSDFFDFWVRQGIIPSVDVSVVVHPTVAEITITTDVPFGVFDVPVVFTDPGTGVRWAEVVEVVHGEGYHEVERTFRQGVKVEVDPADRTLLRKHTLQLRYAD